VSGTPRAFPLILALVDGARGTPCLRSRPAGPPSGGLHLSRRQRHSEAARLFLPRSAVPAPRRLIPQSSPGAGPFDCRRRPRHSPGHALALTTASGPHARRPAAATRLGHAPLQRHGLPPQRPLRLRALRDPLGPGRFQRHAAPVRAVHPLRPQGREDHDGIVGAGEGLGAPG
jgi:hypothetical protein